MARIFHSHRPIRLRYHGHDRYHQQSHEVEDRLGTHDGMGVGKDGGREGDLSRIGLGGMRPWVCELTPTVAVWQKVASSVVLKWA